MWGLEFIPLQVWSNVDFFHPNTVLLLYSSSVFVVAWPRFRQKNGVAGVLFWAVENLFLEAGYPELIFEIVAIDVRKVLLDQNYVFVRSPYWARAPPI